MARSASTLSHEQYLAKRYFEPLDGLRALSVFLVASVHLSDTLLNGTWLWLQGQGGVAVFFVLSGYLITTLALREEQQRGSLSLKAFYVRRTLRIFPGYYYFIVLLTVLVLASGSGSTSEMWFSAFPYYVSYLGEFAPRAHFVHSWSLGIEEKFYLLWPLLCFVFLKGKPLVRIALAALLSFALPLLPFDSIWTDWNTYPRILFGCLLALLLHDAQGFQVLQRWAAGWRAWLGLAIAVAAHFASDHVPLSAGGIIEAGYTLGIGLVLIGLVAGNPLWSRPLSWAPVRFVGQRAYGIYLLHVLCIWGVEGLLPSDSIPVGGPLLTYLAAFLVSVGVADVLYRLIERPGVRAGHRMSDKILGRGTADHADSPQGAPAPATV
jgi:peptidoglycan/LPS O-acetylase OafA/YrhL